MRNPRNLEILRQLTREALAGPLGSIERERLAAELAELDALADRRDAPAPVAPAPDHETRVDVAAALGGYVVLCSCGFVGYTADALVAELIAGEHVAKAELDAPRTVADNA